MVELIPDDSGYVTYQGKRIKCQPGPNGTVTLPDTQFEPNAQYSLREILKDDDSDPGDFELIKDHPDRSSITKVRTLEGYLLARFNPYGMWRIVGRCPDNGRAIPAQLTCSFTSVDEAQRAILKDKGKIE